MIDFALKLAANGFAVLELQPGTKVPLPGSRGVHDATRDPAAIRRFDPKGNLAIATGAASDVVIVDVDPRNDGDVSIARFTAEHGAFDTRAVRTPSGGSHFWFRHVEGVAFRGKPLPGVDFLADGRYALVPPSAIEGVGSYEWSLRRRVAPMSTALLELVTWPKAEPAFTPLSRDIDEEERVRRASKYLARVDGAVSGSGGHAATFRAAVMLVRGFGLPAHRALDLLLREYSPRCDPPWSFRELHHKVRQAAERSTKPLGYLLEART